MTAPLAGTADAPDIPASPMPVAAKLINKIVRICCLLHLMLVIKSQSFARSQAALAPDVRFC
jgi:hypothetical protein